MGHLEGDAGIIFIHVRHVDGRAYKTVQRATVYGAQVYAHTGQSAGRSRGSALPRGSASGLHGPAQFRVACVVREAAGLNAFAEWSRLTISKFTDGDESVLCLGVRTFASADGE